MSIRSMNVAVVACTALFLLLPVYTHAQNSNILGEGALVDDAPIVTAPAINTAQRKGSILLNDVIDLVLNSLDTQEVLEVTYVPEFIQGTCPTGTDTTSQSERLIQRVNKEEGIGLNTVPHNLVEISNHVATIKESSSYCLQKDAAYALYQMITDASALGLEFIVTSAYRSAYHQALLYDEYAPLYNNGPYHRVAKPGHSEHQLGTTVDVAGLSDGYKAGYAFADSPEWAWLQEHAEEYGFVVTYAEGTEHLTGYHFEPWHLRYVGKQTASLLDTFNHTLGFVDDFRSIASVIGPLTFQMQQIATDSIGG